MTKEDYFRARNHLLRIGFIEVVEVRPNGEKVYGLTELGRTSQSLPPDEHPDERPDPSILN